MKNLITLTLILASASAFSQSDSANFYYNKGIEEKTAKRWLVASQYFEKATRFDPKHVEAYLENGNVNMEMRRTDVAKSNFNTVIALQPGNVPATNQLINLLYEFHQYQAAINMAQKCISCVNSDKVVALSHFKLQEYDAAEKLLIKLAKTNPTDAEIMYTIGKTYMEMELEQKAIYFYQKAISLKQDDPIWNFEMGMLYYVSENYKNAVIFFNKALSYGYTPSAEFNENLGYAYLYSKDYEKGEKILLGLHARKPGDKSIIRDLAQSYYEQKKYDKSLEFCQKLMELDIKDGRALYQAGMCFQKMGDMQKGMSMCDKAIELDPTLRSLKTKRGIEDF